MKRLLITLVGVALAALGGGTVTADDAVGFPAVVPIASLRLSSAALKELLVVIRGRVTWVARGGGVNEYAAVQDETAGIWIDIERAKESGVWRGNAAWQGIEPGMLVEVRGIRDREDQTFAPQIIPHEITPVPSPERIVFPDAADTTADRLFSGLDDSQRIRLTGVVQGLWEQGMRRVLTLEGGGRRIRVVVPQGGEFPDPATIIDATVSVSGVATTSYTTRGQFVMPSIFLARGCDLQVVQPPPATAFEAPEIPLNRLGRLLPEIDVRHRIRTRGTVSYASGGRLFYLQATALGVRVETLEPLPLEPGDTVEVSGFLDRERVLAGLAQAAGIVNAVVRVTGHENRPWATVIQPDKILEINLDANRVGRIADPGDYDGCFIECRARVGDLQDDDWQVLPLIAGKTMLTATVADDVRAALPPLVAGCELLIRGIVQFELEPPTPRTLPLVARMSLIVPKASDIIVVSQPSWWTPQRLLAALSLLAVALAALLGWIVLLRRQVAIQSRRLADEIMDRERAEIEFEASLQERTRLAANLHDTVLQTVTGIGFQLKSCQKATEQAASPDAESLGVAQRMVEHAVDQLRGTVWSMSTMPLEGATFPAALEAMAARLQDGQKPRIVVHVAGVERDVPKVVSGNLLLLAEEAVHNALRHANASLIDVMAIYHEATVGVVVHDNGIGFEVGRQPQRPEGHFGIDGMRDRMKRLGGMVTVESHPGSGTTVTAEAPAQPGAPDLSPRPVLQTHADVDIEAPA
jgi:signal transduction histidine kinase